MLLSVIKPLSRSIWFSAAALLLVLACGAALGTDKTYLDCVNDALSVIEQGRTTDALGSLRQALGINANDPLAHVALGLALLEGGRGEDARSEFALAAKLDPDSVEAQYGLGLICLRKTDLSGAATRFIQARQARPDLDMQGSIGYVKWLAGGAFEPSSSGEDESAQAMRALVLMKDKNYGDAQTIWSELRKKAARTGFGERLGCSMSFVKTAPVAVTGWPMGRSYRPVTAARSKLTVVAGNLDLKADLSKARDVALVSFFVDGRFVGMTNTPPFHYVWNTTQTPNGEHTLKIQGTDLSGVVVSEKSAIVLVQNKGAATPSGKVAGTQAEKVRDRLWNAIALKPSAAAINYNLAICDIEQGDTQGAKAALERALAANPTYLDAAHRLSTLYKPSGSYVRLHRGAGGGKTIALTFDDGPKKDAGRILDILKSKDAKATFFVVGKQAEMFPELVKRMADEGHEIGNHTYNHRDLEYLSETEITQEIFKTVAVVRALTGRQTRFLRPPGGHEGAKLPNVMRRFGLTAVYWTSNCAKLEGTTRKKILDYAVSSAKPGGIILLHNLELCTVQALPDIIDALRAKGYSFVTLSELTHNHGNTPKKARVDA